MNPNHITPFAKHEIYVNEIVFHNREDASLWGFLHHGGQFFETQYVVSRKDLDTLLKQNKQTGSELLRRMEQLFAQPHEVPATLNLIDIFGLTQVFEAGEIKLDVPFYEDENGEMKQGNGCELLFIDEVVPFPGTRTNTF